MLLLSFRFFWEKNLSIRDLLCLIYVSVFLNKKSTYRHSLTTMQTVDGRLGLLVRAVFYESTTWKQIKLN